MRKVNAVCLQLIGISCLFLLINSAAVAHEKVIVVPLNLRASVSEVEVVTSAGQVWMDRNLGALRVGGSKSDSLAYGWLFQWGRPADGHESRTSPTVTALSAGVVPGHGNFILLPDLTTPYDWTSTPNDELWDGVSATNNPCPAGFRLPTETEWNTERQSWSINNSAGAFASPLKLVVAGMRSYIDEPILFAGVNGGYWSSTVPVGSSAQYLYVETISAGTKSFYRAFGFSVRCIKD